MRLHYSALLSPLALIPLVLTVPVACGCEPDLTSIAGQMEIYASYGTELAPATKNQALGERAFLGKDIHSLARSPTPEHECASISATRLKCTYWNAVGILYSSGRLVQIAADESGKVRAVSVSQIHKLLGVTFGTDA